MEGIISDIEPASNSSSLRLNTQEPFQPHVLHFRSKSLMVEHVPNNYEAFTVRDGVIIALKPLCQISEGDWPSRASDRVYYYGASRSIQI